MKPRKIKAWAVVSNRKSEKNLMNMFGQLEIYSSKKEARQHDCAGEENIFLVEIRELPTKKKKRTK